MPVAQIDSFAHRAISMDAYSGSAGFSIVTDPAGSGSYVGKLTGSNSFLNYVADASTIRQISSFDIYIQTAPTITATICGYEASNIQWDGYELQYQIGTGNVQPILGGQFNGSAGAIWPLNQWVHVDLGFDPTTATWSGKGNYLTVTDSQSRGTSPTNGLWALSFLSAGGTLYVRNVVHNTGEADLSLFPIGQCQVNAYLPAGVGTHNLDASPSAYFFNSVGGTDSAITSSETISYQSINELPLDSDTNRVLIEGTSSGTSDLNVAPNTLVSTTNVTSGTLAQVSEDPDTADATYMTATDTTANTEVVVAFPAAASGKTLSSSQTFKAKFKAVGGTNVPTARIDIYDGATLIHTGTAANITTAGVLITETFNPGGTSLAGTDGSTVRVHLVGVANTSGSPSKRSTAVLGAVEWDNRGLIQLSNPSASNYLEYLFGDEVTFASAPKAVRAIVGMSTQQTTPTTSLIAKLYDGANQEDIHNQVTTVFPSQIFTKTFVQKPNSGGAWTVSALNALRLRFGFTSDAQGWPALEGALIEAAFPVGTGTEYDDSSTGRVSITASAVETPPGNIDASTTKVLLTPNTIDTEIAVEASTALVDIYAISSEQRGFAEVIQTAAVFGGTTTPRTITITVAAGSLLVIYACSEAATSSVSDSLDGAWTADSGSQQGTNELAALFTKYHYLKNSTAGTKTISVNGTNVHGFAFWEITDVDPTTPFSNAQYSALPDTGSATSPSVTGTDGDIALAAVIISTQASGRSADWTVDQTTNFNNNESDHKNLVDSTPAAITWTGAATDDWLIGVALVHGKSATTLDTNVATVKITASASDTIQDVDANTDRIAIISSATDTDASIDSSATRITISEFSSDTVAYADSQTDRLVITPSALDIDASVDSVTSRTIIMPSATDTAILIDVNTNHVVVTSSAVEGKVLTDTNTNNVTFTPSSSDTAIFVDSNTDRFSITPSATEISSTGYADSATSLVDITESSTETASYIETNTTPILITPSTLESLQYLDANAAQVIIVSVTTETTQVADANTTTVLINSSAIDVVLYTDSNLGQILITPSTTEGREYVDANTSLIKLFPSTSDIAQFMDTNVDVVSIQASVAEIREHSDSSTTLVTTTLSSTDIAAYIDSNTPPVGVLASAAETANYIDTNTGKVAVTSFSTEEFAHGGTDQDTVGILIQSSAIETAAYVDSNSDYMALTASSIDIREHSDSAISTISVVTSTLENAQFSDVNTSAIIVSSSALDQRDHSDSAAPEVLISSQSADQSQFVDQSQIDFSIQGSSTDVYETSGDSAEIVVTITQLSTDFINVADFNAILTNINASSTDTSNYIDSSACAIEIISSVSDLPVHTDGDISSVRINSIYTEVTQFFDFNEGLIDVTSSSTDIFPLSNVDFGIAPIEISSGTQEAATYIDSNSAALSISTLAVEDVQYSDAQTTKVVFAPFATETQTTNVDVVTALVTTIPSSIDVANTIDVSEVIINIVPSATFFELKIGLEFAVTAYRHLATSITERWQVVSSKNFASTLVTRWQEKFYNHFKAVVK